MQIKQLNPLHNELQKVNPKYNHSIFVMISESPHVGFWGGVFFLSLFIKRAAKTFYHAFSTSSAKFTTHMLNFCGVFNLITDRATHRSLQPFSLGLPARVETGLQHNAVRPNPSFPRWE